MTKYHAVLMERNHVILMFIMVRSSCDKSFNPWKLIQSIILFYFWSFDLIQQVSEVFDLKKNAVIEFEEFVRSLNVFNPSAPEEEKISCTSWLWTLIHFWLMSL